MTVLGTLALLGGGEWGEHTLALDARLLEVSGGTEVVVLPTAAAYEHAGRVATAAEAHFRVLGATVRPAAVLHRTEAESPETAAMIRDSRFIYVADGSPLHLRSVLKGSALLEALIAAYRDGAVIAASGAGATVMCDPMVDPRGGAYTVGLGLVEGLAIFPYHGTAADHLRERSIELLPADAVLAGIDEETALIRAPEAHWTVEGAGAVTTYHHGQTTSYRAGASALPLP